MLVAKRLFRAKRTKLHGKYDNPKIHRMESPPLARQSASADLSEFGRVELGAFVATSKRQCPSAWARVEQLKEACRRESPATAAGLTRSEKVLTEQTPN